MWAAWLSIGPAMWFTGAAGALLLGVGPVPPPTILDVALRKGRGAAGRRGVRLRRCRRPAGSGWRSGLPVLPLTDVVLDCAATLGEPETMGSTAFQVDRRRQNELVVELGLRVLRYTPVDIRDRPEQVVSQIRCALRWLAS